MPITLLKKVSASLILKSRKKKERKKERRETETETKILTYNDSIGTWSRISIYTMSPCDDPIILE